MAIAEIFEKNLGKYIFIVPQEAFVETKDSILAGSREDFENKNQTIFKLSATETFSKDENADVSKNPVSLGASVTDHYRWSGTNINFSGVISNSPVGYLDYYREVFSQDRSDDSTIVTEYLRGLKSLLRGTNKAKDGSKGTPLVTIYLPDGNGEDNCVITKLNITKTNKISNGYRVDISATKVMSALSEVVELPAAAEFAAPVNTNDTTTVKDQQSYIAPLLP